MKLKIIAIKNFLKNIFYEVNSACISETKVSANTSHYNEDLPGKVHNLRSMMDIIILEVR